MIFFLWEYEFCTAPNKLINKFQEKSVYHNVNYLLIRSPFLGPAIIKPGINTSHTHTPKNSM